jgi:hypothetical protein
MRQLPETPESQLSASSRVQLSNPAAESLVPMIVALAVALVSAALKQQQQHEVLRLGSAQALEPE